MAQAATIIRESVSVGLILLGSAWKESEELKGKGKESITSHVFTHEDPALTQIYLIWSSKNRA